MTAHKTSFTDSAAMRAFYYLPLPAPLKNFIRKLHASMQSYDSSLFAEPGTLNNQQEREKAVRHLIDALQPQAIIETGTYLGAGTKFFLNNSTCPVLSCEINLQSYEFCRKRFENQPRVSLFLGSSTDFLKQIDFTQAPADADILFYLDAHWDKELPLRTEAGIIFERWQNALVIIDDFAVPHDAGYRYDDYGKHHTLNSAYLREVRSDLQIFYPKASAASETGAKRGSCFVCLPSSKAHSVLSAMADYFISY